MRTPTSDEAPSPPTEPLDFRGGWIGALAPFVTFLAGVSILGLSGAPDETGFGPVLLGSIGVGLLFAKTPTRYAEAVIAGMSHRVVMLLILAWLLAGVLGSLLRASGLVESLVWAAGSVGVSGGGYVAAVFLICAVFSTATGTSLGTLLICAPLLYPPAGLLGADPAFTIGAVLAGATFGDNVSPISDTTIASATTQGADIGGVVRSRMKYALPAAATALVLYLLLGGSGTVATSLEEPGNPAGLPMLLVPILVLGLLLRRVHLVVGLYAGIVAAALLGIVLARFTPGQLLAIDGENFIASGLILDGMQRAFGVSIFTLLLMGLVGGLEASGLLGRVLVWLEKKARTPRHAERWIFGSISAATLLTTHSAVAILAVGPVTRRLGESTGVGAYRRANLLDVTVCTYPFLLPFFIPTILAASLTAGAGELARISPWAAGVHNVHSWALLAVILLSLVIPARSTPPARS